MPGVKRKITKEKGHPTWRLPPIGQLLLRCLNSGIHALAMGGKSVSRGRAFRQGILPWRKGADIPVGSRCAACRPRLTAAQGLRVEQHAIWRALGTQPLRDCENHWLLALNEHLIWGECLLSAKSGHPAPLVGVALHTG